MVQDGAEVMKVTNFTKILNRILIFLFIIFIACVTVRVITGEDNHSDTAKDATGVKVETQDSIK